MSVRSFDWRKIRPARKFHCFLYSIGLGPIIGKTILLLTTTGRKSGQKRVTPLQYEEIDGKYYLGSARGIHADWYKNIAADPRVELRIKNLHFPGTAELVTNPSRIADFLEIRLSRHPFMMGMLMQKMHRLPKKPSREQLEELAATEAMVVVTRTGTS